LTQWLDHRKSIGHIKILVSSVLKSCSKQEYLLENCPVQLNRGRNLVDTAAVGDKRKEKEQEADSLLLNCVASVCLYGC